MFLIFIVVNLCVLILRFSQPDHPRPFRVPLSVKGVAIVPILGIATVFVLLPRLEGRAWWITGLFSIVGLGLHALHRVQIRRKKSSTHLLVH